MPNREINGAALEYVELGQGDTVLLVHGSVSDYRTWQVPQEEFAKHYHTIAYSRRYHHPNAKIPTDADYSMAEQLDDLEGFIQSLGDDPIHLIGHSYGAFLCLLLAMRQPKLLKSLVLAEPPAITLFISVPPKPQQILKLLVTRPRTAVTIMKFAITGLVPATKAIEQDDTEKAIRLFGTAVLGRETFENLSPERAEQVHANLIKSEFVGSGFLPLNAADISRIQVPTLLMNAANSQPLFHRLNDRLHELIPHAKRVYIPNASHIMHEDNPAAYIQAILGFIKQH